MGDSMIGWPAIDQYINDHYGIPISTLQSWHKELRESGAVLGKVFGCIPHRSHRVFTNPSLIDRYMVIKFSKK